MKQISKNTLVFAAGKTFADACAASCQKLIVQIKRAKENLQTEFSGAFTGHERLFGRAISEADALAWQTGYYHLLFPILAREKVQAAADWKTRQQSLLKSRPAYALAS